MLIKFNLLNILNIKTPQCLRRATCGRLRKISSPMARGVTAAKPLSYLSSSLDLSLRFIFFKIQISTVVAGHG